MRSRLGKSVLAILLILSMVIPNIALNVNAEDTDTATPIDAHTVEWVPFNNTGDVQKYLDNGTVPTEDDYLFAGWYTQTTEDMSSLKSYALRSATPTGTTYALFVPKHVLGVRAQVSAHLIDGQTTDADNSASIRFVTSIPSLSFKDVGLTVTYVGTDNQEHTSSSKEKTVYESMFEVGNDNKVREERPWTLLCGASKYFKAHTITGVPKSCYETEFEVTPYWVTLEGDTVYGEPETKTIAQGAKVNLEINSDINGTVSTDKDWYLSGEDVTLTVEGNDGYAYSSLKINNEEVTLNSEEKYTFKATEKKYNVSATFAEKIFADNNAWNLVNQNKGIVSILSGTTATALQLVKQYEDIDITVLAKDDASDNSLARTDVLFTFDVNGTNKYLSVGIVNNGSVYRINSANHGVDDGNQIYGLWQHWGDNYAETGNLTTAEVAQFNDAGVQLRLVRSGTNLYIFVGERFVACADLTNNSSGVTADTKATVSIRHSNDTTVERVIPFTVNEVVDEISGNMLISHTAQNLNTAKRVLAENVKNMELILTPKRTTSIDYKTEKYDVVLDFGAKDISFYIGYHQHANCEHNNTWCIANLNLSGSTDASTICPRDSLAWPLVNDTTVKGDEFDQFVAGKLNIRIVRDGTDILLYLGERHLGTVDVSVDHNDTSTGITADTEMQVLVRHYGVKPGEVQIPFILSTP